MAKAKDSVIKMSCVLAPFLIASVAAAQSTQRPVPRATATETRVAAPGPSVPTAPAPSAPEKTPAGPPKISYVGGQLKIEALDSTLGDVLTQVAALTGVKIDIPAGASSEPLRVSKLGPGPARQVLASLLSKSDFDYVIMASATEPQGIQKVVLIPREKRGGSGADLVPHPSRSPYAKATSAPASPDETPEPVSPVLVKPDNTAAQASPATPAPTQPDQPTQPELSATSPLGLSPAALSNRSGLTTEGAMSPPSSLDPQSINQQLQQMYQQRIQITQQEHQSVPPGSANPGSR